MADAASPPGGPAATDGSSVRPDPLESESDSDDDEHDAAIFSEDFAARTGVHVYVRACQRLGIVPVQQLVAMMDADVLNLKHRGVGAKGGVALFEYIRVNRCIKVLDLEDNQLGLGLDADAGGVDHIADAIADNASLAVLNLAYNSLGARGCAHISPALGKSAALRDLSLRGNNVGDAGAGAIACALAGNLTLTKLDVADNQISPAGAQSLADLLQASKALELLDVSWNSLRAEGVARLAAGLVQSTVQRVNLAWNSMGVRGAREVAAVLRRSATLQHLDLSKNAIEDEGAIAIADALRVNTALRSLQLNGNPCTARGAGELLKAIGVHRTVRDIGVRQLCVNVPAVGLFDPLNPTGHFRADLATAPGRALVEAHREADRQEASSTDSFLNVALNGSPLDLGAGRDFQDWAPPGSGTLVYDYVSGRRPPAEARAPRDDAFRALRRELASTHSDDAERLVHLRFVATSQYFSCSQAWELIASFSHDAHVDVLAILFRRLADPVAFGSQIWARLAPAARAEAERRLGDALDPFLPEDAKLRVFLTQVDERRAAEAMPNARENAASSS